MDSNYNGNVTLALSGNPGGSSLGGTLSVQAVNGVATFTGLTIDNPGGGYTLQATSNGLLTGTSSSFTVTNDQLVVTDQPSGNVAAGAGFGFSVSAENGSGNLDASFNGRVTVSFNQDFGGAGTLGGTVGVTAINGVATFSGLMMNQAGVYSLSVASNGMAGATTSFFNVNAAAATQLVATTEPPSTGTVGAGFEVDITAEDSFGNVDPTFNGSVTLALASNPAGGTLGGTLTATAVNGVATFSGLTINTTGSGYTLKATAQGLTNATTSVIDVTPPAVATQLVVTTQPPSSVNAGSSFGLVVEAEDGFGTVDTTFNGIVTVNNPAGGAPLGQTTAVNGVASFTGLTLDQAGDGTVLSVTSNTFAANTNAFTVNGLAATQLEVVGPFTNVLPGSPFVLEVYATDPYGNIDSTNSDSVTLALANNPGSATLGGMLTATLVNGFASFSGLTISSGGSGYTLQASSTGLTAGTSDSFDVTSDQLVVTTQPPSPVAVGSGFGFLVAAENASGDVDTSFNGPVTVVLLNYGSNSASLGGSLTATAVNGVATFSGLTLDQAGFYGLDASSSGLNDAVSNTIQAQLVPTVTWSPPANIALGTALSNTQLDATANVAGNFVYSPAAGTVLSPGNQILSTTFIPSDTTDYASVTSIVSINVIKATTFTSASSTTFVAGQAGSFTLSTTSFPTAALTESGLLPGNVTFTDNGNGTATLNGSPALTTGAFTFNVVASNGISAPVTQVFTLTVSDPPKITSPASTTFTSGKTGSFSVTTASGLPAATTLTESGLLPSGVKFVAGKNGLATLSGKPAANSGGTYSFTITASNGLNSSTSQPFTLTVDQAPTITGVAGTIFSVGQPGSFTVKTAGFPVAAITESGTTLPNWLSFTDNGNGTATLSGTPPTGSANATPISFTIDAANGTSPTVTQAFNLTVDEAPTITSGNAATFAVGKAGTFAVKATAGLPSKTTFSIANGKLPGGVTLNPTTGVLSGKSAAGSGGIYNFDIVASSNANSSTSQPFTLTVDQAPTITGVAGTIFSVGQPGSFTVKTAGFPVAAITESGTTLPNWLSFTDNGNGTATLSGTPPTGSANATPISFTIDAANGTSPTATQAFNLTVDEAPTITSGNAATFAVGKAGTFAVKATAGLPSKTTFSIANGKLPGGVTLNPTTGVLSGKSAAGSGGIYNFDIVASSNANSSTSQPFTLTVDQAPTITGVAGTIFSVGQPGSFTVKTAGFPVADITESGTTLPNWHSITDNGNGTATLSGTPPTGSANATPISFTIDAANGTSPTATQAFNLTVDEAPTITSGNAATFAVGKAGTFAVKATAGLPSKTTFSIANGKLPGGVTLNPTTGVLSGKSAAGSGGIYNFDIVASSNANSSTSQPFTLTVDQATAFTSTASVTFSVGRSSSFTFRTTGFPIAALKETGVLAAGLTFVDNGNGTATLSGIPNAGSGGNYALVLTATAGSTTVNQTFSLTVNQPPVIISASSAVWLQGQTNSFNITTEGFPAATISVDGTLPAGVKLIAGGNGTAVLTGKPTASGTYTFTIVASNAESPESMEVFFLTVN